jgi:glucose-1-phosphate thymidylyltransferase
MAGMGKRMRPHTLTTPKPLLHIAGKSIVQRLVEDITRVCGQPVEKIAFVVGHFGEAVEKNLLSIASSLGARGSIHYQEEALGTAHAILCAESVLDGPVIVAFADTLFRADFELDDSKDGVLWVQKIENPEQFGVVVVNDENVITDFIEKPTEFISDLAMIGIYYFKDGRNLRNELQFLIDNNVLKGGEYQLPDALENITANGKQFTPGTVIEWLDCGNKNATVYTNQRVLEFEKGNDLISSSAKLENCQLIEPCYIGENVVIRNSIVGPHVSVSDGSVIEHSVVRNSIIYKGTTIRDVSVEGSMIGNHVKVEGQSLNLSLGDFTEYTNE